MAASNRERIGKGLDLLAAGVRPFFERELSDHFGKSWEKSVRDGLRDPAQKVN